MFKIPFQFVNITDFSDHGWRFGRPKAFYITIDDTLIKDSNDLGASKLEPPSWRQDFESSWTGVS